MVISGMLVVPAAALGETGAPGNTSDHETVRLDRPRDLKPLATFGIGVGVQTVGVMTATLACVLSDGFSDTSLAVSFGVTLAVTPMVDATVGWILGKRSKVYTSPFAAMAVGAYLGAGAAYALVLVNLKGDNPEVDRRYDAIYFGRSDATAPARNVMTFGIASVFLPAMGAALGHFIMRRLRFPELSASFSLPSPMIVKSPYGKAASVIGLNLVGMRF